MKRNLSFIPAFSILIFISGTLQADPPPNFKEALIYYQKGHYDQSLEVVRSVFQGNENSYELRMLAAANYGRKKDVSSAIAHLNYVQKDHPGRVESYIMEAGILRDAKDYRGALMTTRKGLQVDPGSLELKLEQAKIFYETNQIPRARTVIDSILKEKTDLFIAIYLDALLYLKEKRYDAAEFRFRQAKEQIPEQSKYLANLYNNLGYAREMRGRQFGEKGDTKVYLDYLKDSINDLRKAIELDPGHRLARENLSRVNAQFQKLQGQ